MANKILTDFVTNGSDNVYQDIVSKLSFIAQFKQGFKVDIRSLSLMEDTWFTTFYRTVIARGESKDYTFDFCRTTIDSAFSTAVVYLQNDAPFVQNMGISIIRSIKDAKIGVVLLKKIYSTDEMFMAKIDTFIKTVDIRFESLTFPIPDESKVVVPSHSKTKKD